MNPADQAIRHVVLLMMENHSFDQMLGSLQSVYSDLDGVDMEADPPRFNLDRSRNKVFQNPTMAQHVERDLQHETIDVLEQISNGNSGFVTNFESKVKGNTDRDRQEVMGYYPLDYLPALHELGRNFTVCDHWFSSLPGPTWPNRFFALSGTSSGRVEMPLGVLHPRPGEFVAQDQVTLFDRLNEAGKDWKIYYYDFPLSLLLNNQRSLHNLARYALIKDFFRDTRDAEHFPAFVFIEPKYMGADQNDDHPPHNIFKAEKLIADVYNAIRSNRELWESTLLVVTYDEHGGFYDHLEPPATIPPDAHHEEWDFTRFGVRVPAILVSPFVRARVERTVFDHTSLLKYLQEKWGLGALGNRTAAANSIGICLDLVTPRKDTVGAIRVSYASLIPAKPEIEQFDVSRHHVAIHAFAAFLAREEGVATSALVAEMARGAGMWMRANAALGRWLRGIARRLSSGLEKQAQARVAATFAVARSQLAKAEIQPPADTKG